MTENLIIQTADAVAVQEKASYDIQVATAKQYPRDVRKCVNNMIVIATMTKDSAEKCGYVLPRGGKKITGGSIHLAKIIAQNWGNIRVESKVTKITATNIYAESVCFDLESNTAFKVESSRKIVSKTGTRFNEDLITLTGQVCASIAMRNAIFSVVPKAVVDQVYNESVKMITGDLSDSTKVLKKRNELLNKFKNDYKVTIEEICTAIGINSENQINVEEIKVLIGMLNSLKEKEFTVDEMFGRELENKKKEAEKEIESVSKKLFEDENNK